MKIVLNLCLLFILGFASTAQSAGLCTDPFHQAEVCLRMRHLRATVNSLDGQREMMQINFDYMANLGLSMKDNTAGILAVISMDNPDHVMGLRHVLTQATQLENAALNREIETFEKANLIRTTCMSCHSSARPPSGVKWDEVFAIDWDRIAEKCNAPGRNPYICKSMNGLYTTYAHILTGVAAGIQDFKVLKADGLELLRILKDLKAHGAFHVGEALRAEAEFNAREVVRLADLQDPAAFEGARALAVSCTSCHSTNGRNPLATKTISVWNTKN
jgi:hypothetical protein